MDSASANRAEASGENKVNYVIRQGVCLVAFLIHLTLFWGDWNPYVWSFAIAQGFIYPAAIQFIPYFRRNATNSLLIDSAVYGVCLGLWGFNIYLLGTFFASINIINIASGGFGACVKGAVLMLTGAMLSGALIGFHYRAELPFLTLLLTSFGLVFFLTSVGMRIHKINTRLRNTRSDLQNEREELVNLNTLALAVNSHLDVDIIMRCMMSTLERIFPVESMYILAFDEEQKTLDVSGVYGSGLSQEEQKAFRNFRFDSEHDRDSLFIHGLKIRRVTCIASITPEMVANAAPIDQALFAVKSSVSLAYFPVFVNDKVVAGACFINYETPFELSQRQIDRIQQYLVQAGTAIRNATLFNEVNKAKTEAEVAQQKAESSEEAKSRFLANMSHEIRTPLTAIMGYSEALMEDAISRDEQQRFLGYILRSGKHLLSMINDILDISKIEASKIQVERIECNLMEVLSDIDSYMHIKAKEKDLNYRLIANYPIPQFIITDPTRLRQILLNLCNNAVKFTEQGHIYFTMSVPKSNVLQFDVDDSGIGIDESEQAKVFNAFDQADTSTTRLFGGTGLGLYISKNLAQLLGGDIRLKSAKGMGSTFSLSIPFETHQGKNIHTDEQFLRSMSEVREAKTYSEVPQLKGRVLLAEDNKENQNLIIRLIKRTGMEVDLVKNGQQAVDAAASENYVVILMDMQMPVIGGREAAAIIRKSGNKTPIVAFTANVMKHDLDEYRELGFAGVLEKPIVRAKLFETLKNLTQKREPTQLPTTKVLVVEDNEVNRMILIRYITKSHPTAEVLVAVDGAGAIAQVTRQNVDLIFMDMEMPGIGGLEATAKIRELGHTMPIYVVSGNIGNDDVRRCMDAGANGHIAKPLNRDQIVNAIYSSLQ